MKRYSVLFLILFAFACNGVLVNEFIEGLSNQDDASWITDGSKAPKHDSLFYLYDPAPIFRKEFEATKTVKSAKLYITAAGYYVATLNGRRVGKEKFDPAWTDYSKRIYYTEHDVTSLLQQGQNCLGVALGNGFYNPLPLRMWGQRNLREVLPVGRPEFIAKLLIVYKGGAKQQLVTDSTWKFAPGPVIKNNVFLGEVYDARREIEGWNEPGFDDTEWSNAVVGDGPGGDLQKAFFPPMEVIEKITPIDIYPCPINNDNFIIDMGYNITGVYRIKLKGNPGDTIIFRSGERIYEDGSLNPMTTVVGQIKREGVGGPGAPPIAWQEDQYILGGNAEAWYSPEFTYHTYRYLEVSGLDFMPEISNVEGLFIHTAVEQENSFTSSSGLLNSIQNMATRTFLGNLVSVQTDCPAREKFGYGGDLNAISESYIYNFDMYSFYKKTVYDWLDAINDSVFVDTAPYVGIKYCGLSWESAYLVTQYFMYLYYNNIDFVEEMYEANIEWMDKAARIHPEGIVDSGLSDHESLEPVPVQLIGTTHYLKCARIMQEFARMMNDEKREEEYSLLADRLQQLVKERFWDKAVEGPINRQTLFATLIYYDIIPEDQMPAARDSLLAAVKNGPSGHFNTGIFGTKYILEALSRLGLVEHVFNIVNSTTYPGWGYMVHRGATTIWETWQESDNTYSNSHPMFGSVSEWYYRYLGGIRPNRDFPGFEKFYIWPSTPKGLHYVNLKYHTPHGMIVSNWEETGSGSYRYDIEIPAETLADVKIPFDNAQQVTIKKLADPTFTPASVEGLQTGHFELAGGAYIITVSSR
jgi:alpha-L-rhamnosidase